MLDPMRILHTSDWHLGRRFHGVDMSKEHAAFCRFLLEALQEHEVDVLIIAGDVYDRAMPPLESVQLLDRTLAQVVKAGVQVIISAGNHDSPARLGFGSELMSASGVHIFTDVQELSRPLVLEGKRGEKVSFFVFPYLNSVRLSIDSPAWLSESLERSLEEGGAEGTQGTGKNASNEARGRLNDTQIFSAALKSTEPYRAVSDHDVLIAHCFVAHAASSEGEKEIRQGGIGGIPRQLLDGFDYAALGHLHRRQSMSEKVRYSGSPLPLSFSEERYRKGVFLIDLVPGEEARVSPLDFEGFIPVVRLEGTLERLLHDPSLTEWEEAYVQATLTDDERPEEPMARLRKRFPHTLVLQLRPTTTDQVTSYRERLNPKKPVEEVLSDFYDFVRSRPLSEEEKQIVTLSVEAEEMGQG